MPYTPNDTDIEMIEATNAANARSRVEGAGCTDTEVTHLTTWLTEDIDAGWVESPSGHLTMILEDNPEYTPTSEQCDKITWNAWENRDKKWD